MTHPIAHTGTPLEQNLAEHVPEDVRHKPSSRATWRARYLWDTLDKDPAERWFLFKLDAVLLTLASAGYFIKVIIYCTSRASSYITSDDELDVLQEFRSEQHFERLCVGHEGGLGNVWKPIQHRNIGMDGWIRHW